MEILTELGLTSGEIKVYLLLLSKNSLKVGEISKETNLNRSNLYKILEKLINKKLIFFSTKKDVRFFSSTRPERLKELYNQKLSNFKKNEKDITRFISHIENFPIASKKVFSIEVHEGVKEIKQIISDFVNLNRGEVICAFGREGALSEFPGIRYWFDNLIKIRAKKGINFKAVYHFHKNAKSPISKKTEIKYEDLSEIENIEITFYRDILLISLMEKDQPRVVLIRNQAIVNVMKSYFDLLWGKSKKV